MSVECYCLTSRGNRPHFIVEELFCLNHNGLGEDIGHANTPSKVAEMLGIPRNNPVFEDVMYPLTKHALTKGIDTVYQDTLTVIR